VCVRLIEQEDLGCCARDRTVSVLLTYESLACFADCKRNHKCRKWIASHPSDSSCVAVEWPCQVLCDHKLRKWIGFLQRNASACECSSFRFDWTRNHTSHTGKAVFFFVRCLSQKNVHHSIIPFRPYVLACESSTCSSVDTCSHIPMLFVNTNPPFICEGEIDLRRKLACFPLASHLLSCVFRLTSFGGLLIRFVLSSSFERVWGRLVLRAWRLRSWKWGGWLPFRF